MNPLERNPRLRQRVYDTMWVVGGGLTLTQIGFVSVPGAGQPTWLTVALAVFAGAATLTNYTARENVDLHPEPEPAPPAEEYQGEHRLEEG